MREDMKRKYITLFLNNTETWNLRKESKENPTPEVSEITIITPISRCCPQASINNQLPRKKNLM